MEDEPKFAQVIELLGKTGGRGGITQVKVKLTGEGENGREIIRNVLGPVRKGDNLKLMEAEREARRMR